ncbi:pyridoxal phosphate-dependent aminotransferase [Tistrella mobilis]
MSMTDTTGAARAAGQASYGFRAARRLGGIGVSEILAIGARAQAMGADVIVLAAGEPDLTTPAHIRAAAAAAVEAGATRYAPLTGTAALKAAIIAKHARDNRLDLTPANIIVGSGAKQVIHNALMATLDEGQEVIVPAPFWTSYLDQVALAGGRVVSPRMRAEDGFRLTPEALAAAITPNTGWLILNAPSNPCGAVYSMNDLKALAAVLRDHPQVWVLSDDIYEHIIYDGRRFVTMAEAAPDLADRVLTVNGVSKAYAMTGWRIGWGAGPAPLIQAMAAVQSQSTSGAATPSQAAATAALDGPQEVLADHLAVFDRRRTLVTAGLEAIDGISCPAPDGAFYAFADIRGLIGRTTRSGIGLHDDRAVAQWLLDEAHVALVPGAAFGSPGHLRLSFAAADAVLHQAIQRIGAAVADLPA